MVKLNWIYTVAFTAFFLYSLVVSGQRPATRLLAADNGDGTYTNPILPLDYSDPDAIRVGNDYYMTASSFNCIPGLPILHSKDLVNWKLVNYALNKQEPTKVYDIPQHGKGVWAPSLNYHNGEFRIYYPDPDYGIFMVKAKDPLGVWEKPTLVLEGKGIIDPSVFWDEDGKAYLAVAWAASRAGVNSLLTVFQMDSDGAHVVDDGKHVYDGHGVNHTVEGPKFYKRNGYYYLFAPAGGVATGWQLVLRSKSIYGPFEDKIVMHQGSTSINGPHQGALIQTSKGEYWFLHFQDKGVYGRVVHLQPVKWYLDWPIIGVEKNGVGEPVDRFIKPDVGQVYPIEYPMVDDEFNGASIGLQWQWHANAKVQWSALLPNAGFLRLFTFPYQPEDRNLWSVPNLLLQKFPAEHFTATTKVKLNIEWDIWQGKRAGLLIMGNDYAYLSISKDKTGYRINQVVCKDAVLGNSEKIVASSPLSSQSVEMKVEISAPNGECMFSYSEDGVNFKKIGQSFQAKQDKWIGAKVGLFSISDPKVRTGGYADFDYFRITR